MMPSPTLPISDLFTQLGLRVHEDSMPLYEQALTHSSYTYEFKMPSLHNYERLEFLGDAVLKIIISQYLFRRFPQYREGELTKIRAVIVSDAVLARFSAEMNLGDYMILGPSEAKSGGRKKVSNLACAFEAFLGALYLDGQLDFATNFIEHLVEDEVTKVDLSKTKDNYKAALQELTQADGEGLPEYRTIKEDGPPHRKIFHIEVLLNGEVLGLGKGASKKEAQQMAAKMALACLNQNPDSVQSFEVPDDDFPSD